MAALRKRALDTQGNMPSLPDNFLHRTKKAKRAYAFTALKERKANLYAFWLRSWLEGLGELLREVLDPEVVLSRVAPHVGDVKQLGLGVLESMVTKRALEDDRMHEHLEDLLHLE